MHSLVSNQIFPFLTKVGTSRGKAATSGALVSAIGMVSALQHHSAKSKGRSTTRL